MAVFAFLTGSQRRAVVTTLASLDSGSCHVIVKRLSPSCCCDLETTARDLVADPESPRDGIRRN